jgi:hypothetical protein
MPEPAIGPADFKSLDALLAQLPDMLAAAPKEEGRLDLIVMRPEPDARVLPRALRLGRQMACRATTG